MTIRMQWTAIFPDKSQILIIFVDSKVMVKLFSSWLQWFYRFDWRKWVCYSKFDRAYWSEKLLIQGHAYYLPEQVFWPMRYQWPQVRFFYWWSKQAGVLLIYCLDNFPVSPIQIQTELAMFLSWPTFSSSYYKLEDFRRNLHSKTNIALQQMW